MEYRVNVLFPHRVSAENLLPVIWKTTVDKWEIDALHAIVAEESNPKPGNSKPS